MPNDDATLEEPTEPDLGAVMNPPIDWWTLDDSERVETLHGLGEWVVNLVRFYELSDKIVPPCWYMHDAMIQELLALWQYREEQQYIEAAPPGAGLDFHHQFGLAMTRLAGWNDARCNSTEHREGTPQRWYSDLTTHDAWRESFETYLNETNPATDGEDS